MKGSKFVLTVLIIWRVGLLFFQYVGIQILSISGNFLGGGIGAYSNSPFLWSWANFDGEHYISIARWGYRPLEHFFYPLYPYLIKLLANILGNMLPSFVISGLMISHGAVILGLIGLYKLIVKDYTHAVAKLAIVIILVFPSSFYLVSVYTEALFLCLVIWCFYFVRTGKFFVAGLVAAAAVATRSVGLVLIPALIVDVFLQKKAMNLKNAKRILFLSFAFIGLAWYMQILHQTTGSYFGFNESGEIYGEYRSGGFTILPQVFYRYYFKILPYLNYNNVILALPSLLELITAVLVSTMSIVGILKLRLSYLIYLWGAFLLPASFLNFNSQLRFAIVLFPMFIVAAQLLVLSKKTIKIGVIATSIALLVLTTMMFVRGYWIA